MKRNTLMLGLALAAAALAAAVSLGSYVIKSDNNNHDTTDIVLSLKKA